MNRFILVAIKILAIVVISCNSPKEEYNYPAILNQEVTEIYHGINILDPYRNLENLEDSTVVEWLREQSKYAYTLLNNISGKQKLIDKQNTYYSTNRKFSFGALAYSSNGKFFYTRANQNEKPLSIFHKVTINAQEECKLPLKPNCLKVE